MISKLRNPGSAITHFIAMILAFIAAFPLLTKASGEPGHLHVVSLAVFIISMILLYGASTLYHTLDISPKVTTILRKIDHMMIFVLIAGTYTPVCLIVLGDKPAGSFWLWYGVLPLWELPLSHSGLHVQNGFLPLFTLPWDGYASWQLQKSSLPFHLLPLCGFWPEG